MLSLTDPSIPGGLPSVDGARDEEGFKLDRRKDFSIANLIRLPKFKHMFPQPGILGKSTSATDLHAVSAQRTALGVQGSPPCCVQEENII